MWYEPDAAHDQAHTLLARTPVCTPLRDISGSTVMQQFIQNQIKHTIFVLILLGKVSF